MALSSVAENFKLRAFYKWGAYLKLLKEDKNVDISKHFVDRANPLGFELQVKRSEIDRGGLGLFVKEGCQSKVF